ncbi:MAG: acylphosphatase [Thermodesulfobacteriota bacterium]
MGTVRAHIKITGLVQGVFFRAHTRETAMRHGVHGWVRNTEDGGVEAVFEGEEGAVREVINWCHEGPPAAAVEGVAVSWYPPTDEFRDFRVVF